MDYYLSLILGFAAATIGGELFVRRAVGLARSLRIVSSKCLCSEVKFVE